MNFKPMNFNIRLAGLTIGLNSEYPALKDFCQDYLAEEKAPDFSVSITRKECMEEQKRSFETGQEYSFDYLAQLALLRRIGNILPAYGRCLLHGASITYQGSAYLFAAPSGTGKSTHIRLWKEYLGSGVEIVNGDKPILSVEDSQILIHGTPWAGKEGWQRNRSAVLRGICLLKQGKKNRIERQEPWSCLPRLLKQIYLPQEEGMAGETLRLLDRLLDIVPVYQLECDRSEEAVRCSFEAMTELPYKEGR